jgi:ArsR family transcriptional regulator, virulence genes transcriptional regulator
MKRRAPRTSSLRACQCLKGLSHPARLAILCELRRGPRSVGDLMERVGGLSQSNLSQHLSKMQGCGLLASRREGAQIFYEVANPKVFDVLDLLQEIFCS